jgi:hypothetical protein
LHFLIRTRRTQALLAAETTTGFRGGTAYALKADVLLAALERAGRRRA